MSVLLAAVIAAGAIAASTLRDEPPNRATLLKMGKLDPVQLSQQSFQATPAVLEIVYDAFSETEEDAIYDRLAEVSSGDALEQLYLERIGAMVGGGLEPDQAIHELEVLDLQSRADGNTVAIEARWRVLGIVGHAEHMHVRGNTYAANLSLEPVDGTWRMTGFELTDVDRSDVGTMQPRTDL